MTSFSSAFVVSPMPKNTRAFFFVVGRESGSGSYFVKPRTHCINAANAAIISGANRARRNKRNKHKFVVFVPFVPFDVFLSFPLFANTKNG